MIEKSGNLTPNSTPIERVGPYTREEFINRVRTFHGYPAPGVLVGGIMVDLAMGEMSKTTLFDAICETSWCLPDSIQLLTPCTVGNGWLKIINLGRWALSLYDKYKGNGVRIYLDPKKMEDWDSIKTWLLKLKPKKLQDDERLQQEIWMAGRSLYTIQSVQVKSEYLTKRSKGDIGICSTCGEAYPIKDGKICLGCQGQFPYESLFPLRD